MTDVLVLRCYFANHVATRNDVVDGISRLLDERLPNAYRIEVIDVLEDVVKALEDEVFATPTVVKHAPGPKRAVFGDLSDPYQVLSVFGVIDGAKLDG